MREAEEQRRFEEEEAARQAELDRIAAEEAEMATDIFGNKIRDIGGSLPRVQISLD